MISTKILYILGAIIIVAGGIFGYQKFYTNKVTTEKTEVEVLGNSQKATDKYNQLLIKIAESGEEDDGGIITIGGETHEWGRMEKIKFLIVTIPAISLEEQAEFTKAEDGKKVYRVAYENFLTPEEIEKIKIGKEGLGKDILISKENIVKR